MRWSSTAAATANPVDVENFTLNPEIVAADMAANQRWLALSGKLTELRRRGDVEGLRTAIDEAFTLLNEVGPERSPHQSAVLLRLERAQVEMNIGEFDAAFRHATKAYEDLAAYEGAARDTTRMMEAREMIAFIELQRGNAHAAEEAFRDLLRWIDHGSSKEMPMVRVAAKNMRRSVLMGLGETLLLKSKTSQDPRVEAREALDHLIEALSQHVDESDFPAGKRTIVAAYHCFMTLGDKKQAAVTCERLTRWCTKHDDEAGLRLAQEFKARTGAADAQAA
jgi:hypothetical protein